MKIIALAAAVGLALTTSTMGYAQGQGPAVSPVKLDLAKQMLEAQGGQERASAVMKLMIGAMTMGLQKTIPPAQARLMGQIQSDMQTEMVAMIPALVDVSERVYAQNLTEKELRDELAWMRSDSGRSIQQKTPLLMQQVMQAEVPMIRAMIPKLTQRVLDRVCAELQCSTQDRQVIAAAMAKASSPHAS
jgi:hypothetical protein